MPIAAANEGGGAAGIGVGLGAGLTMAHSMMNAVKPGEQATAAEPLAQLPVAGPAAPSGQRHLPTETKFCTNCGKQDSARLKILPGVRHALSNKQ